MDLPHTFLEIARMFHEPGREDELPFLWLGLAEHLDGASCLASAAPGVGGRLGPPLEAAAGPIHVERLFVSEHLHFMDAEIANRRLGAARGVLLDRETARPIIDGAPVAVSYLPEVFLDVNIVSYLARAYARQMGVGRTPPQPVEDQAVGALRAIVRRGANLNTALYIDENAPHIVEGRPDFEFEVNVLSILKNLDHEALLQVGELRPKGDLTPARYLGFSQDTRRMAAQLLGSLATTRQRLNESYHASLLIMALVKLSDRKSARRKMQAFLSRSVDQIGHLSPRMILLALDYFEGRRDSFFSKVQRGSPAGSIRALHNMAWDLNKLRALELHVGTKNPDGSVNVPFVMTADQDFLDIIRRYRLQSVWRKGDQVYAFGDPRPLEALTDLLGAEDIATIFDPAAQQRRMEDVRRVNLQALEEELTELLSGSSKKG